MVRRNFKNSVSGHTLKLHVRKQVLVLICRNQLVHVIYRFVKLLLFHVLISGADDKFHLIVRCNVNRGYSMFNSEIGSYFTSEAGF